VLHWIVIFLVLAFAVAPSHGQTTPAVSTPVDAGGLLQQQRQLSAPAAPDAPAAAPQLLKAPASAPGAAPNAQGTPQVRVLVQRFRIQSHNLFYPEDQLQALLTPAIGKDQSLQEMRAVVDNITALYRGQGYFLARALLPAQDVSNGDIQVQVLEGRLDPLQGVRVLLAPAAGPAPKEPKTPKEATPPQPRLDLALAERIVKAPLTPLAPLRLAEVERAMLLLNDLPGVQASATLEPGSTPDTTRLVVEVQEQPLWRGRVSADNHGSRYTQSERLGLELSADNPSGKGDEASLQLVASPQGDYRYGRLGYSILALPSGLRLGASASALAYQVGAELTPLDVQGSASVLGLQARWPLLRSRTANLFLNLTADHKRLHNTALDNTTSDKRVTLLSAGLSADRSGVDATSAADLTLSTGRLQLQGPADSIALDQGAAGANTQGNFGKLNFGATRLQRLGPHWLLSAQVQGQMASKNLDSSEKFVLGGANGVRAYPSGEAAGDSGLRASLEARWQAANHPKLGQLSLLAFVDWGRIKQQQKPVALPATGSGAGAAPAENALPNSASLAGAGVGAALRLPQGAELRLNWARKIGSNPLRNPLTGNDADGREDDHRFWLSLQMNF